MKPFVMKNEENEILVVEIRVFVNTNTPGFDGDDIYLVFVDLVSKNLDGIMLKDLREQGYKFDRFAKEDEK